MKTPLTLHLNPSHLVVPVGTIYCVAVEHNERLGVRALVSLGTRSHYFVLLHKGDKEKCERAAYTSVHDGSCSLSNKSLARDR